MVAREELARDRCVNKGDGITAGRKRLVTNPNPPSLLHLAQSNLQGIVIGINKDSG